MANILDKYKQIQSNLATKKSNSDPYAFNKATTSGVTQNTPEQNAKVGVTTPPVPDLVVPPVNQTNPTTPPAVPPVTPTTTGDVTTPAPIVPEVPVKPQETPVKQEVKTETPTQPQNVPPTTPIPPKGFEYGSMIDTKTGLPQIINTAEANRMRQLSKNKSLYTNGKSIYDAVTSGALKPGTQAYSDLAESNPNAIAEYNAIKKANDQQKAIKTLGDAIVGKPVQSEPTNLESLLNTVSQGLDEDVMTTYKNLVTNDPRYAEENAKVDDYNKQLADVKNNINTIGADIRKKMTLDTPESVVASKIAREAKPLIDQAQYISDQLENAKAEATRIFEENRGLFDIQMADRADKRNLAFKLYDTINADEIRQEDIQREDTRIEKEIALEEYRYQRELADGNAIRAEERKNRLDDLRSEQDYNLQTGLLQLGVDPTGMTPEEMKNMYSQATGEQIAYERSLQRQEMNLKNASLNLDIAKAGLNENAPQFQPVLNEDGTMKISQNSVYDLAIGPEGNSVQVQGVKVGGKAPNGRTECGAFVNDLVGTKIFGNSLSDKTKNINSDEPVVGGAFIEDVGQYGHVGFIESVNPDGSINIIDSNYSNDKDGKIRRDTIIPGSPRWNQIKGFYDPSLGGPKPLDSNQRIIANTEKSAFRGNPVIKAFEEGLQQYKDIVKSLGDESGPGDTAGIFQFMKSLDPNSVVRESEFDAAAKSAGVAAYIGNTFDRISKGKKITPEQAIAFKRLAGYYVDNRAEAYNRLYDDMARSLDNQGIHRSYFPTRATDELTSLENKFQNTDSDIEALRKQSTIKTAQDLLPSNQFSKLY